VKKNFKKRNKRFFYIYDINNLLSHCFDEGWKIGLKTGFYVFKNLGTFTSTNFRFLVFNLLCNL